MSSLKPITLWSHAGGPNPWKVAIILNELDVPYENKVLGNNKNKEKPYTDLNPNGRLPTIEDPNTGMTLWESAAIIQYLIDTYDKDGKISYKSGDEQYKQLQWLAFQVSGQGPYFGQATWFQVFHPEKLPSAIERYQNEIARVNGVLDSYLQNHEWLVGDKVTFADLAFVTWANIGKAMDGGKSKDKFPAYDAWLAKLNDRPSVKKAYADQEEAKKGSRHQQLTPSTAYAEVKAPSTSSLPGMTDPTASPSIAESLDIALANFFASHNPFTYILLGIITIILVYPLFTASDPDIHPFLLARQASAAPIRNLKESPLYRALDVPHGYPLRSALGVKDIGAAKWTSGRRGDLRDVLARAVTGPLNADSTAHDSSKVGKVWTLKGKDTAIPTEMKEVMRLVNAIGPFTRGRVAADGKVAVCLSNSVELLACIFAAAFYDFSVTLLPYGLPQELTNHLLQQIDVHVLVAEAGTLNLDTALPCCKSLKQVILVAKPDSNHMDWASTPTPKGVSVATWDDLTTSSDATSEVPTVDHKDGPKPKPLGTFQLNTSGEMELSEFTSDNLISGISALLTTLPRTQPLSSTDSLLPTTPLTHPYTLTYILAGLYSNSSVALNSVSGPTVDLFATAAAFKPTILITSPGTLSKFLINYSRTGLGPSRFSKFFQRRSLRQGIMPGRKPIPDLNSKDAMFLVMELAALSKVRAVFVGQDVAADVTPVGPARPVTEGAAAAGIGKTKPSPKLTSKDLDELRVDLGVKIGYALTSGKVAGAVAQTHLADYRDKGAVVCVGPPVGSVEVMLLADDDGAVDGEGKRPVGKIVVKGPAVVGESGEAELDIVAKIDADNTLVLV